MTAITPIEARDEIIEIMVRGGTPHFDKVKQFYSLKSDEELEAINRNEVIDVLQSIFEKVEADFYDPTKESLLKIVEEIKDIGPQYIDKETVEADYKVILNIINKIE